MITESAAVQRYPELGGLIALRRAGWQWAADRDGDGFFTILIGHREIAGHLDALYVYHQGAATAVRMVIGESRGFLWKHDGPLSDCVAALGELPDPGEPHAPRLVRSGLWLPN